MRMRKLNAELASRRLTLAVILAKRVAEASVAEVPDEPVAEERAELRGAGAAGLGEGASAVEGGPSFVLPPPAFHNALA